MRKVADNRRSNFLHKMTGNQFLRFEGLAYNLADNFSENYNGGYWDFYALDNGGFFMALDKKDTYRFVNAMNYTDIELDGVAFGAVITLFALGILAERSQFVADKYYLLRDAISNIFDKETASKIYRAID